MSGESGYMPRNFSELKSGGGTIPKLSPTLKSGGTIPMLSPHAEKWGDDSYAVPQR